MKRRLDIALGLVHRPRVLFLDEPTTGLDPEARASMWVEVERLAAQESLTILLTTHYLEEADRLAQRVAIVSKGRVVVEGTPDELKRDLQGESVSVELHEANGRVGDAERVVAELVGNVHVEGSILRSRVPNGAQAIPVILGALDGAGIDVAAVTTARPSLDDVYLHYTGRDFTREHEAAAS
jgi:ABC-2 type transport system ATP-binding protein